MFVTRLISCTAALLSMLILPDTHAADLECRMSVPARVASRTNIPLTFELINHSKATYNVLNWNTPFEGFYGPYLQITGPGGEVEYKGPVVKRSTTLTREEYVSIKRGGRISKTVNLAKAYDFKAGGRYEIGFSGKLTDATKEKIPHAWEYRMELTVDCAAVSFDLAAAR